MGKTTQHSSSNGLSAAQQAEVFFQNGWHYAQLKNFDQAIVAFNNVLELYPAHAAAIHGLASCLAVTSRTELALKTYQSVLRTHSENWEILSGIANCYSQLGNFEEAIKYYKKALKVSPENLQLIYNLGLIYKYNPQSPTVQTLLRLYNSPNCDDQSKILAGFILGKMYDSHGEHHLAFRYYDEANRTQFNLSGYKEVEGEFSALFDHIETTFNAAYFADHKNAGVPDTTPIFVLGMPRSGTSLVEQILASHPTAGGAGETDILHFLIRHVAGLSDHHFLNSIPQMETAWFEEMAQLYLLRLRDYCPGNNLHIVDKTPNNFFLVGLIRMLFPRAAIIHCVRDPMDNCWSLFRQYFSGTHPYCYDQAALGTMYRRYQKLMQHWHDVLPGQIHDIHYEELLDKPEATIRKLLDYCQLPWDEQCLSFHNTKRVVNTASMAQVRQPLYKTSLRSWEPLAQELLTLQTALN